jgi:CspA family cold shock protein
MAQGTVRWFSEEKGYGVICPDDGKEDVSVHYTEIAGSGFRSLQEGERVIYELIRNPNGRSWAVNVSRL